MNANEDLRLSEFYKYHVAAPIAGESLPRQYNSQNGDSWTENPRPWKDVGVQATQLVSPDTTLTAFCQLAAIRLGVQRCGISLISRYQQYILAESTRTTNLADTTKSDDPEDSLWMGVTECERQGNLCENTVALPPAFASEVPPCFTVLDLRDSRFQNAPYVTGPPYKRFYCGTPLSTDRGSNIGSLWVIDNRLLPEFTPHQKKCFGTIAALVMKHLVMNKENSERRKAMRMGQALSAFVDGKVPFAHAQMQGTGVWLTEDRRSFTDPPYTPPAGTNGNTGIWAFETDDVAALDENDKSPGLSGKSTLENGSQNGFATFDRPDAQRTDSGATRGQEERSVLFTRASLLMKDALEATGCIFLDTAIGSLAGLDHSTRRSDLDHLAEEMMSTESTATPHRTQQRGVLQRRKHSTLGLLAAATTQNTISAEVLGYAIKGRSSWAGSPPDEDLGFTPLDEQFLLDLASTYPEGMLWSFEESGIMFPIEGGAPLESSNLRPRARRAPTRARREAEAELLREHFSGVRQLLFAPLHDLSLGWSSAGCFAFSNSTYRVFAVETELPFMRSFINNVAAEISRMDAFALSSTKSDFIGSISHELRSPLHGVLAACEFLSETSLTNYQKSLIETQISCGKTLLQVIEQVLDYSKINSFEKVSSEQASSPSGLWRWSITECLLTMYESTQDERSAGRHSSDFSSESLMSGNKMQNLFEQADVCELCEEVVEGSVAGKAHLSTMVGLEGRKHGDADRNTALTSKPMYGFTKNVAVILDFDYQVDWVYVVQPGALRRILMNILGNALKYTQAGCIQVKLSVRDAATPGSNSPDTITLSVSDTGKGISKDFLRKRLFTPFNQEDHLSTGCGLGLSIVKSLTTNLNGTIEVRSEQGVGTTVSVNLPLSRGSPRASSDEVTVAQQRWIDPSLWLPPPGTTVGYVGFRVPEAGDEAITAPRESKIKESIKASVSSCMADWLRMEPLDDHSDINDADYVVILVDEKLSYFIQPYVDDVERKQPRVIALLPNEISRREVESALGKSIRAFEVVSAPFGPRKMARAVKACEKTASTWSQSRHSPPPSNAAPLRQVAADMVIGTELLQVEGLSQNVPRNHRGVKSESPELPLPAAASRPQSLIAVRDDRSSEPISTPQAQTNELQTPSNQASETTSARSKYGGQPEQKTSRILLVDDNLINLRFLETYIKKRRPHCDYDCAEDGLEAVKAAEKNDAGYSVVFMDLSMPVMDGLEATRQIRALEKDKTNRLGATAPAPALIVALTGLASGRDQANAFASGVDLFMTKPVKFKEIGKLLDDRIKE